VVRQVSTERQVLQVQVAHQEQVVLQVTLVQVVTQVLVEQVQHQELVELQVQLVLQD